MAIAIAPCLENGLLNIPSVTLGLSKDSKPFIPYNVFATLQYNNELLASLKIGYVPFGDKFEKPFYGMYGPSIAAEIGLDGCRIDLGGNVWLRYFDIPLYNVRMAGSWLRKWDGENANSNYWGVNMEFAALIFTGQVGFYRNSDGDNMTAFGIGLGF